MKTVKRPETEEVNLIIRNVNGVDTLFTEDGRLIANQSTEGFFYYVGNNPRYKTFRTSFLVDHRKVDVGPAVETE